MLCLSKNRCLDAQCGNASPGDLRALPDNQQDGLSVNENCPTGKTENQQDENSPLEIHSHLLEVATSKGLSKRRGHNPTMQHLPRSEQFKGKNTC